MNEKDRIKRLLTFNDPSKARGFLSNSYPARFSFDDVTFTSVEQYLLYQGALFFGDFSMAKTALAYEDPIILRELQKEIQGYSEEQYGQARFGVLIRGVWEKFKQNPDLADKLIATRRYVLVYGDEHDLYLGNGLPVGDPRRFYLREWPGENNLGKALMTVRRILIWERSFEPCD